MTSATPSFAVHLHDVQALIRDYAALAREQAAGILLDKGKLKSDVAARNQRLLHGLAWTCTLSEAAVRGAEWGLRLAATGRLGPGERAVLGIGIGEYLDQLTLGVTMSQNEVFRPHELDLEAAANALRSAPAAQHFIRAGNSADARAALIAFVREGGRIDEALPDDALNMVREQYRRFANMRILPYAHGWHLADALIPDEIVIEMAELGTFGVCIPEEYGGLGLGKIAMCIVTEELSRAWIAAGSLGTRSEIAGELILQGGTPEQKAYWLPKIASGEVLPTAVFTEPDTGSDLGSVRTRASRQADGSWRISGAKTWITHAARSDLMTVLARSGEKPGYAGLSMFLAAKKRGTGADPFPSNGMSGSEIAVLG
ncbi:MAG: acyl-CoA/acyl-ACP dehydrogenase, partial [Proteobacteria bacterium]|nr:acyl-CoA/acyl-ACP dehydrogenase [Pseudomonadota bacterium]